MNKHKSLYITFQKFFWYVFLTTGIYLLFYFFRVWKHFKDNTLNEFPKDNKHVQPIGYSLFYIFFLGGLMKRIHSAEKQYCDNVTSSLGKLQNNAIYIVLIIVVPSVFLVMLPTFSTVLINPLIPVVLPLITLLISIFLLKDAVNSFNNYFAAFEKSQDQKFAKRTLHWWEYLFIVYGVLQIIGILALLL
jgi:ABC-type phosphate transport system permease subunit